MLCRCYIDSSSMIIDELANRKTTKETNESKSNVM